MDFLRRIVRDARAHASDAARRDALRARRVALKEAHRVIFEALAALFFEIDPVGINYDENTDEYEPEVGTVLPRLAGAKSLVDVNTILTEEFDHWFGRPNYNEERLADLAVRTWALWTDYRTFGGNPTPVLK